MLGGFRAIITTDLIQFSIMALFILILGGWAYSEAGKLAPEGIITALKSVSPPWSGEGEALNPGFLGWIFPIALLIGYLPGWLIEQDLDPKGTGGRQTTRQARVGAGLGFLFITTFIIVIPAFVAFLCLDRFQSFWPRRRNGG